MEDSDLTEQAGLDTSLTVPGTVSIVGADVCPRCFAPYDRAALAPPEYKCSCGMELAYPDIGPGGEVRGVLGWLASPGAIVHQRYRVVQLLGRGGFGATYLVEDLKLSNKRWALKEIPESLYDEHESRILSKLNHPSIPGITDREITGGMVYMVLEFGGNRTLESVRRATPEKRVALTVMAPWTRQLCDVLAYMHAQTPPIVHRDLKPGNVLLDDQDRVMLIDFGIAKEAIASEQTRALGRAVTHGFSPPEQAMGSGTDARSDIYALGATVYYMLTGQRPPGARERIQGVEIPLPSTLIPGMPPAIDRALLQALSLNPNERQQTVQEFGQAFDYEAPTIKTYDDFAGPDRTVMVGSAATSRSVPATSPQKSLKLGPDGAAVAVEQQLAAPRGNQRAMFAIGAAVLVALAIVGTYLLMRPAAVPATTDTAAPPTAALAPATSPPLAPPAAGALTSGTPAVPPPGLPADAAAVPPAPPPAVALTAPAPAPNPPATPNAGPSAMEELMKRRPGALEPVAVEEPMIKPKPKPVVKPAQAVRPKPAPVAAAAPPAPVVAAPASPEAAANAWREANKNTQFQE